MTYRCSVSTAAFFDLDKTILATSSSFAFARPFHKEGLIGATDVIRSAYAQFMFRASGANHDQMENMRDYMSSLIKGWDVATVQRIVNETLDEIIDPVVYFEALELIESHRAAGHDVIIVSSSGTEIVFYAYGEGKADAIRTLAEERGYDLDLCFAYSDSVTDLPMLQLVGNPIAVNPDDELRAVAEGQGWRIHDFAKPVALQQRAQRTQAVAAGAGVALGAVALGLTWYARRRSLRA